VAYFFGQPRILNNSLKTESISIIFGVQYILLLLRWCGWAYNYWCEFPQDSVHQIL